MMNSDTPSAAQILADIVAQSDERALTARIDVPVDRALETFRFIWRQPISISRFHAVLGRFIRHAYRHLGSHPQATGNQWAVRDAIVLLETGYQSVHETGYDGALMDLKHSPDPPTEGIDIVLVQLAQLLKASLRQKQLQLVFTRNLDPLDPATRCAVVAHLLGQNQRVLPPQLLHAQPFEFADYIPDLLETLATTRSIAQSLQTHPALGDD